MYKMEWIMTQSNPDGNNQPVVTQTFLHKQPVFQLPVAVSKIHTKRFRIKSKFVTTIIKKTNMI